MLAREITLPAAMSRPGLTVARAKEYLAVSATATREDLAYTTRTLPIGTPAAIHAAILRAAAQARPGHDGPALNWVALLTNPHIPPAARLTLLRVLAAGAELTRSYDMLLQIGRASCRERVF